MKELSLNFDIDCCLEPYHLEGPGLYSVSSVKKIIGSDSYTSYATKEAQCQTVELYEDCLTKAYINSSLTACQCVPYELKTMDLQVKYSIKHGKREESEGSILKILIF